MGDCVESLAEVKVDNIHGSAYLLYIFDTPVSITFENDFS